MGERMINDEFINDVLRGKSLRDMDKDKSLAISKIVDCYLNTQVNNLFDLAENMKALNNFQVKIDELQEMKDAAQLEYNGLALILLRKYVMEEKFGKQLMRNLIRQYYDLNDEQIPKYETCSIRIEGKIKYYITNPLVYKRKGKTFNAGRWNDYYNVEYSNGEKSYVHEDMFRNSLEFFRSLKYNPNSVGCYLSLSIDEKKAYMPFLLKNLYVDWSNAEIRHEIEITSVNLSLLLNNWGYIAWQGIDNIKQTILHIQQLNNKNCAKEDKGYITDENVQTCVEYCMHNIYGLYSYLPLQKSFVIEHQDKLDWQAMELNPRIEWTLPLVQLLLKKHAQLPEPEQSKGLKGNQNMFDKLFKSILNDDIIRDLEKLYGM